MSTCAASAVAITVTSLRVTAVKGTRLRSVDQIELDRAGARGNRRFYVIDARDRLVNSKILGELQQVVADYDEAERRLTLSFPDGKIVDGPVRTGREVTTRFFSTTARGRLVDGPWAAALSDHTRRELRLVQAPGSVDRGPRGAVSLISRASVARLAQLAGASHVDARRFRMLIEVDGLPAHAEDAWVGGEVRFGRAVVAFGGHVGRCLITSRDPDSGEIDLPTLDILRRYRGELDTTEPLAFGIYGEVVVPGTIAVGDPVVPGATVADSEAR